VKQAKGISRSSEVNHLIGRLSDHCLSSHNQPQDDRALEQAPPPLTASSNQRMLRECLDNTLRSVFASCFGSVYPRSFLPGFHPAVISPLSRIGLQFLFLALSCFKISTWIYARRIRAFSLYLCRLFHVLEPYHIRIGLLGILDKQTSSKRAQHREQK
jgi:hypothetical protein